MKIHILTIFPEYFESPLKVGLLGKAIEKELIKVNILNLRDYTLDKHRVIDDEPFGGGEGMVFKPEPIYRAILDVKSKNPDTCVVYLSPKGKLFNQKLAEELAKKESLLFICGRYEGIDQRIVDYFIDEEISIGDYVVFGGEVASLVILETLARLVPGVVGTKDSVEKESFTCGLLKHSCYTRPRNFLGYKVPEVLTSGDHKRIDSFRKKESIELTVKRRPELLKEVNLNEEEKKYLREVLEKQRFYLFLLHYPVYNKNRDVIASATANFDLHDLARLARTYDLAGVYIIQPLEDQRELILNLKHYWTKGKGAIYNPLRKEAIELIEVFTSFEEAVSAVEAKEGKSPILISTDASPKRKYISCEMVRELLWEKPVVLVLGTAWGLCEEVLDRCDYFVEPIWGRLDPYNHLSVRSAGAIFVEKILGIYSFCKKSL